MSGKGFSRRAVTIGGGIAAALGIAALGITAPRLFEHRYPHSPYDDLLAQLTNREAAAKVGKAVLGQSGAPSGRGDMRAAKLAGIAKELRKRLERRSLAEVTSSDLAQGSLTEVKGWVLPATLVMLCTLAAGEDA